MDRGIPALEGVFSRHRWIRERVTKILQYLEVFFTPFRVTLPTIDREQCHARGGLGMKALDKSVKGATPPFRTGRSSMGQAIFGSALEALQANRLRSFLTMLGVIIGVSAVISVVTLTQGVNQSVT